MLDKTFFLRYFVSMLRILLHRLPIMLLASLLVFGATYAEKRVRKTPTRTTRTTSSRTKTKETAKKSEPKESKDTGNKDFAETAASLRSLLTKGDTASYCDKLLTAFDAKGKPSDSLHFDKVFFALDWEIAHKNFGNVKPIATKLREYSPALAAKAILFRAKAMNEDDKSVRALITCRMAQVEYAGTDVRRELGDFATSIGAKFKGFPPPAISDSLKKAVDNAGKNNSENTGEQKAQKTTKPSNLPKMPTN